MTRGVFQSLAGKRFGKWLVLQDVSVNGKRTHCLCKCDCGTIKQILKESLKQGSSTKCHRCKRVLIDLTGQKFSKLLVIKHLPNHKYSKNEPYWECQCICGKIFPVARSALTTGRRTRCRQCTYEELTGQKFGSLTVLKRDYPTRRWLTRCDCGFEKLRAPQSTKAGRSCGRCETMRLVGQKFGKLTILKIIETSGKGQSIVSAKCDCGNIVARLAHNISRGIVRSCGCLRHEKNLKKAEQLIGKTIGFIKIIKIIGTLPNTQRIVFLGKCRCGKIKQIPGTRLGSARSCGCLNNHPKGEAHHFAKLSNAEAQSIRELTKTKLYKTSEIAKLFGVSESTICNINANKIYKT